MLKLHSINLHLYMCNKNNTFECHIKTEPGFRDFLKYLVPESLPVQGHDDHGRVGEEALVVEGQVFPLPRHIQHVSTEQQGAKSHSREQSRLGRRCTSHVFGRLDRSTKSECT